jgi:hypothetical protein
MKEDIYGPLLTDKLKTTETPLSASELRTAVEHPDTGEHPSIQRVYGWIKNNKANLVAVGTTTKGGTSYRWRDTVKRAAGPTTDKMFDGDDKALEIGSKLEITAIKLASGHVVIEMQDENGGLHTWHP